MTVPSVVLD